MQTQQKQKTAFRARKVTGDFEKQAPEQKLKESQIKKRINRGDYSLLDPLC